jgi:hypothetical protein
VGGGLCVRGRLDSKLRNFLLTNLTLLLNRWVMASVSEDGEWAKTNTMQVVKYSSKIQQIYSSRRGGQRVSMQRWQ